jgi:hypothetical protein
MEYVLGCWVLLEAVRTAVAAASGARCASMVNAAHRSSARARNTAKSDISKSFCYLQFDCVCC